MKEPRGTAMSVHYGLNCDDSSCVRVAPLDSSKLSLGEFCRTPFGVVPETVLHRLGLFDFIVKEVASQAEPYCSKCTTTVPKVRVESAFEALKKRALECSGQVEGIFVAAVPGTAEIPLAEQMELLESDRAIVDGRLVKLAELTGEAGSPVLAVGATPESLEETVRRWLSSGGSLLKVFYFSSRTSEGVELQQFSDELRCSRCGELFPELSLQGFDELPPCPRCKGAGWFVSKDRYDTEVLHACLDCSGVGCLSNFFEYRFCSVPMKDFLTLSFRELLRVFASEGLPNATVGSSHWRDVIKEVAFSPMGEYRCGTPISLLSYDERFVLTALQCLVIGYRGRQLLFDVGTLSSPSKSVQEFLQDKVVPSIPAKIIGLRSSPTEVSEESHSPTHLSESATHNSIHISDVVERGIRVDHFSFPKGKKSFILGGIEGAHSKLLEIVANRFLKRKKFSHAVHFEGCTELITISPHRSSPVFFADLVGATGKLAELYAATSSAQRLGLQKEDFKVIRSVLICPGCGAEREVSCDRCGGEMYDWRLSTVRIGSLSFQDVLHLPIATLVDSIVLDDSTDFMLRQVVQWVPESTTLATATSFFSPSTANQLSIVSRLMGAYGEVRYGKLKKRTPLVLVDIPSSEECDLDAEIKRAMDLLCERGATILCGGGELKSPEYFTKVFSFKKIPEVFPSTPYFHEKYTLTFEPFEYHSVSG